MSVYGYVRVSTARQADGDSLASQQRQIEGYAQMRNLVLDHVFVEEGVSGSVPVTERPMAGAMLDVLLPGDVVIAPKLDRLFRSAADALNTVDDLKRRNVQVHLLDLGGDITGGGVAKFFFTMVAAFAEMERDRIKERNTQAKAHGRATGRFLGGARPPFGYQVSDGVLVEDDREQQAIRHVMKLHGKGESLRKIRDALVSKGFEISHVGVGNILKRAHAREGVA